MAKKVVEAVKDNPVHVTVGAVVALLAMLEGKQIIGGDKHATAKEVQELRQEVETLRNVIKVMQ